MRIWSGEGGEDGSRVSCVGVRDRGKSFGRSNRTVCNRVRLESEDTVETTVVRKGGGCQDMH